MQWLAHKQLAETIHSKIQKLLDESGLDLNRLDGVAVYKGPGSFTGLRIGIAVANSLAEGQNIPIVSQAGDNWLKESCERLMSGENEVVALPEYGAQPHITAQKK